MKNTASDQTICALRTILLHWCGSSCSWPTYSWPTRLTQLRRH